MPFKQWRDLILLPSALFRLKSFIVHGYFNQLFEVTNIVRGGDRLHIQTISTFNNFTLDYSRLLQSNNYPYEIS